MSDEVFDDVDDGNDSEGVELESVEYGDIDDTAMEVFEDISDSIGAPVTDVIDNMPAVGVEPTEITEEQAEALLEAQEEADEEKLDDALEDIGVEQPMRGEIVESFRGIRDGEIDPSEVVDEDEAEIGDESGELPAAGSSEPSGGGVSRAEVQRMVREETPDADEIASTLEQRLSSGGGGGGGQQQAASGGGGGGGGGMNAQQEMAIRIAQQYLGNSGGGKMSEVAEQAQENMMEAFANQAKHMAQPSLGQRIGQKIDQKVADQKADELVGEMFGDGLEVDDGGKETAADGGEKEDE